MREPNSLDPPPCHARSPRAPSVPGWGADLVVGFRRDCRLRGARFADRVAGHVVLRLPLRQTTNGSSCCCARTGCTRQQRRCARSPSRRPARGTRRLRLARLCRRSRRQLRRPGLGHSTQPHPARRSDGWRAPLAGLPGKTPFPRSWSADRVMHEISDVATDPAAWANGVQQGSRTALFGVRDGVQIRVVVNTRTGDIITGYPLNLPRNPR
jgi:hypothetical protein